MQDHKFKLEYRPVFTTGQLFLHSWRHFFGLQRSELTIAIRVNRSAITQDIYKIHEIYSLTA